jgi:hypothetical protein
VKRVLNFVLRRRTPMTSTELTLEQRVVEAKRVVDLRELQMQAAALAREEGEIDLSEWDAYAARYAAAVKEWRALQFHKAINRPAVAETTRGATWVQG